MTASHSEVRHTPGPWRWGSQHEDPKRFLPGNMPALIGADGTIICDFGDNEPYYPIAGLPPNEMDSALISAAPDMYEALLKCVAVLEANIESLPPGLSREALDDARAAVVKARCGSCGDAALAKAEGREAPTNA